MGERARYEPGSFCWVGVEQAKSFYADLLGWEYEAREGGYTLILNAGRRNGGIREQVEQERGTAPNWVPYFTVASADDAARAAERAGGRTLVATTDITIGRFAAVADPQGAVFCLFEGETDS